MKTKTISTLLLGFLFSFAASISAQTVEATGTETVYVTYTEAGGAVKTEEVTSDGGAFTLPEGASVSFVKGESMISIGSTTVAVGAGSTVAISTEISSGIVTVTATAGTASVSGATGTEAISSDSTTAAMVTTNPATGAVSEPTGLESNGGIPDAGAPGTSTTPTTPGTPGAPSTDVADTTGTDTSVDQ